MPTLRCCLMLKGKFISLNNIRAPAVISSDGANLIEPTEVNLI